MESSSSPAALAGRETAGDEVSEANRFRERAVQARSDDEALRFFEREADALHVESLGRLRRAGFLDEAPFACSAADAALAGTALEERATNG